MKYLTLLLICTQSFAGMLKLTPSGTDLMDIPLNQTAQYDNTKMTLRDANVISKKVGLVNIKVMIVEKFSENEQTSKNLNNLGMMSVRLTLLRNIDSDTLQSTINDYLSVNISDDQRQYFEKDIEKALQVITSEDTLQQGMTVSLLGNNAKKELLYENTEGKIFTISPDNKMFINKVFGIWFY